MNIPELSSWCSRFCELDSKKITLQLPNIFVSIINRLGSSVVMNLSFNYSLFWNLHIYSCQEGSCSCQLFTTDTEWWLQGLQGPWSRPRALGWVSSLIAKEYGTLFSRWRLLGFFCDQMFEEKFTAYEWNRSWRVVNPWIAMGKKHKSKKHHKKGTDTSEGKTVLIRTFPLMASCWFWHMIIVRMTYK